MDALRGIIVPFATPFDDNDEVDTEKAKRLIDSLIAAGVHGLIVLGDTGEFFALTPEERARFVEFAIKHIKGRALVVVQPSAITTRETIAHARHAQQCGADALMVLPPYYRSSPEAEVYAHYEAVAKAVDLPIIAYCLPGVSAEVMTPAFLARLAGIDNIRYVKDSTGILPRIRQIQAACGDKLRVFVGGDTIAYDGLVAGAIGSIWGAANFMPRQAVRLFDLVREKEELLRARELWDKMFPICDFLEHHGYAASVKAGLALTGLDVGPPRRPALPLTPGERSKLAGLMKPLGLTIAKQTEKAA
ncbi:MAG: dihydrodipicolinate synthase family protein [Chloroflexota bacterium]|nr:dihydrodipicolinate synthase family protein [Chloroflexota bacterium]